MLPLQFIFRDRLILWAENHLEERLVVAQPVMTQAAMPVGVRLAPHKIVGKRVLVRNRRDHHRIYHAEWPQAGLHDMEVPKLVCVLGGATDYVAGKYVISCNEGQFILLPPRTPNRSGAQPHLEGSQLENGYCELLQIVVLRDEIRCSFCISAGPKHLDLPEKQCIIYHPAAVRIFHVFMNEALTENKSDPKLQEHLLAAFFRLLWQEAKAGREAYTLFQTARETSVEQPIDELRDYLRANLRKSMTLEQAARHVHMSRRQFTRYLRREAGKTYVEILTECRIEEAKRLLETTPATVTGISWLVGFQSVSHFRALFQRCVGCSPNTYRQQQTIKISLS